ncbi:FxLYD domain-containing protein [Micromonospora sp. NPDC047527]|uniref:FxLYD domain-containing protein n=1 Tax=Micromonospora sp. NPDC047527 TaxID=3155144 RepID=UPI0033C7FF32
MTLPANQPPGYPQQPQHRPPDQYPPHYPPAPGGYYPPPTPPPKKGSFWGSSVGILLIIFGSIAILGVICGGLVLVGRISDSNAAKQIDVQLTSCGGTGSVAKVGYTVTNNGSQARRVTLKLEYRDATGARLDTDTAYVGSVPAGDTVRGEESTILNATSSTITCKVVGVS